MTRVMAIVFAMLAAVPASSAGMPSDSGWVRVVTMPEGAPVYLDGRYVGTSPVDSIRCEAGRTVVQAQRGPRYQWNALAVAETVDVFAAQLIEVRFTLPDPISRVDLPDAGTAPSVMRGPGEFGVKSETWTMASGAAMVASGVLAAVLRDKANRAAARYLETRDPASLDDVRRYDRLAGAAMVGVQISLGAFVLFLAGP